MLARTADNLFWLARSMERADYIARTIEATLRLEYLPKTDGEKVGEWEGALNAAGAYDSFVDKHGELDEEAAIEYLTFDLSNSSSICNCLENARAAGRAVRTALTAETWTAINDAWLELKRFETSRGRNRSLDREELMRFLDYVKKASLDFDGSCYRTMLRNDAYWFNRLGIFVERADNTARLLDVKYHLLLPSTETGRRLARLLPVGGDPARGLGCDRLSLGLSRPGQAVADRRPPDPQARRCRARSSPATRASTARSMRSPAKTGAAASPSARRGRCTPSSSVRA